MKKDYRVSFMIYPIWSKKKESIDRIPLAFSVHLSMAFDQLEELEMKNAGFHFRFKVIFQIKRISFIFNGLDLEKRTKWKDLKVTLNGFTVMLKIPQIQVKFHR